MHPETKDLPYYQSHKIVRALKIADVADVAGAGTVTLFFAEEGYGPKDMPRAWFEKHAPAAGGYYIVYPDGYESFSPAEPFENGYTKLNPSPGKDFIGSPMGPGRELTAGEARGAIYPIDEKTELDLRSWFSYHSPKGSQAERYIEIRLAAMVLARTICQNCPPCADRTAAIRKVREAVMTANAAIACNE